MVVMTKKVKTFEIVFSDASKSCYSSGDKVAGRIVVEVCEVTKVSTVRVLGIGCAKVDYTKGKQRCREEVDYLRYEEALYLDGQPRGKPCDQIEHGSLNTVRMDTVTGNNSCKCVQCGGLGAVDLAVDGGDSLAYFFIGTWLSNRASLTHPCFAKLNRKRANKHASVLHQ